MDITTLRGKSDSALNKELEDAHARLTELRFKLSSNQVKNVREVRVLKRTIARIKTILKELPKEAQPSA
jgi:ribosomal protein L29